MITQSFTRLSLSRQFLIASFPIFLLGMLLIGTWVGMKVESGVVHRLGGVTGLYVESFIAAHVQTLVYADDLTEQDREALDALLTNTPLGKRIVAFKIWRRDGRVLYSKDKEVIGHTYPVGTGLASAFLGQYHSQISELGEDENKAESEKWPRLIETYVPVHGDGTGRVIAAAEFYQTTEELSRESRSAQLQSWLIVASTLLVIYLLLFGLVHRGSQTIEAQRQDLNHKVAELTALNSQNDQLHDRVLRAAARTTALNESYLRRVSADLHDGPGQDISLALMQIDSAFENCATCLEAHGARAGGEQIHSIRSSLKSGLADLRAISTGLQLPDIVNLSIDEVAARAVRDYERKTAAGVALVTTGSRVEASLPVKITLYRLLQESLANGFRHAGGSGQRVEVTSRDGSILVEVCDSGAGFDSRESPGEGHLGLAGMRERVEVLGGSFALVSNPGKGTVVRITLPLFVPE